LPQLSFNFKAARHQDTQQFIFVPERPSARILGTARLSERRANRLNYRSSGFSPVERAIFTNIRGPISSPS
jgi:hypothetical protein